MKKILSLILASVLLCCMLVSCASSEKAYNYDLSKYIKLSEYKNMPAVAVEQMTDEEIEQTIEDQVMAAVNYYSKVVAYEEGHIAQKGDVAVIEYTGYVPAITSNAFAQNNVNITLGLGEYPEELEKAIIGHKVGDTFSISLTLPDPFEAYPDYAGQDADLFVTIDGLGKKEAPIYNDDFARAYLFSDSTADYEQSIRDSYIKINKESFYEAVIGQTWSKVVEEAEVIKYPEKELKGFYNQIVDSVNEYVTTLNLDFTAFIKSNFSMTEEEFYEYAMTTAEASVKEEMVVYAIARAENITVSDEEYKTLGLEIAKDVYGLDDLDALEEKFTHDQIEVAVLTKLVQNFIADNAAVTYN